MYVCVYEKIFNAGLCKVGERGYARGACVGWEPMLSLSDKRLMKLMGPIWE